MKRLPAYLAALVCAGAAHAADLPARKPAFAPTPLPVLTFEGLYVGAHAGYLGYENEAELRYAPTNTRLMTRDRTSGSVIGGLHAGYDWRFGSIVAGVVGDVSGARAANTTFDPFTGSLVRNEVNVQGSVRGRVGYAAFDRLLVYATGGLNVANVRHQYRNALFTDNHRHVVAAPTVGVGVEYAVTDRWSARVEYRISGLGTGTDRVAYSPLATYRHPAGEGSITAGVSYRFGK